MGSNLGRLQEDGQWRFNPQREAAALGFLRRHRGHHGELAGTGASPCYGARILTLGKIQQRLVPSGLVTSASFLQVWSAPDDFSIALLVKARGGAASRGNNDSSWLSGEARLAAERLGDGGGSQRRWRLDFMLKGSPRCSFYRGKATTWCARLLGRVYLQIAPSNYDSCLDSKKGDTSILVTIPYWFNGVPWSYDSAVGPLTRWAPGDTVGDGAERGGSRQHRAPSTGWLPCSPGRHQLRQVGRDVLRGGEGKTLASWAVAWVSAQGQLRE
jgi:hypothetical protein